MDILRGGQQLRADQVICYVFYDGLSEVAGGCDQKEARRFLESKHRAVRYILTRKFSNKNLWSDSPPEISLTPLRSEEAGDGTVLGSRIVCSGPDVSHEDTWRLVYHMIELTKETFLHDITILMWDNESDFLDALVADDEHVAATSENNQGKLPSHVCIRRGNIHLIPSSARGSPRKFLRWARLFANRPSTSKAQEKATQKLDCRLAFMRRELVSPPNTAELSTGMQYIKKVLGLDSSAAELPLSDEEKGLYQKLYGHTLVWACVHPQVKSLLEKYPHLLSAALTFTWSHENEMSLTPTEVANSPVQFNLENHSGVLHPVMIKAEHLARVCNGRASRLPRSFLIRHWGTIAEPANCTEHELTDARYFGCKLSHALCFLWNKGLKELALSALAGTNHKIWTDVYHGALTDVDGLSSSNEEIVNVSRLASDADQAEAGVIHACRGPCFDQSLSDIKDALEKTEMCHRVTKEYMIQTVVCQEIKQTETCSTVYTQLRELASQTQPIFPHQIDFTLSEKEITILLNTVSGGEGESLAKILAHTQEELDEQNLESEFLDPAKTSPFGAFDKLMDRGMPQDTNAVSNEEQDLMQLAKELEAVGMTELAEELKTFGLESVPVQSVGFDEDGASDADDTLSERSDLSSEDEFDKEKLDDALLEELRTKLVDARATGKWSNKGIASLLSGEDTLGETLIQSRSMERADVIGPASLLIAELSRKTDAEISDA